MQMFVTLVRKIRRPPLQIFLVVGQRVRNRRDLLREFLQENESRTRGVRRLLQFCGKFIERCVLTRERAGHFKRVAQTGENLRIKNLGLRNFSQTRSESEQMTDKISTVHTGDVEREKRLERARVIPIIEMPAMSL